MDARKLIKVRKELEKYYRVKNFTIDNLKNRLIYLETLIVGVGAMTYSDMPTGKGKKESCKKEKYIDEKTKVLKSIKENEAYLNYIETALNNLDDIKREILICCYANPGCEKDYTLYTRLNISRSSFYRMRKEVLEQFAIDLIGVE